MTKETADVEDDEFVCEKCGTVWDIEDSTKRNDEYICPNCAKEQRRAYLVSDAERADILDIVQAWENDRVRTTRSTSAERAAARQVAWRIRDALRVPGTRA